MKDMKDEREIRLSTEEPEPAGARSDTGQLSFLRKG